MRLPTGCLTRTVAGASAARPRSEVSSEHHLLLGVQVSSELRLKQLGGGGECGNRTQQGRLSN
jgi:hypothetical protein